MKTEYEKMIAGEFYSPMDPELRRLAQEARTKQFAFNQEADGEKRSQIIKSWFGSTGENLSLHPFLACDYGVNIYLGENFYANMNCVILDEAKVTFGDNVFIAPSCGFYTAGHPLDAEQRNRGLEYARPIHVGNNVWIGAQVCVLPGVTIGDNAVIGAGSVVNRDIPGNVIAAGNPCRVIRQITEKDKVKYTL